MRLRMFNRPGTQHSLAVPDGKVKAEPRVLVVDDNRDAATMLAMVLRGMGYSTVAVVHDAYSALKVAREQRTQVALIDLVMPDMDGFELARRLRSIDPHGEMRLIALTGFADDLFARYAKDAKFDGFLAKPASAEDLESVLEPRSAKVRSRIYLASASGSS